MSDPANQSTDVCEPKSITKKDEFKLNCAIVAAVHGWIENWTDEVVSIRELAAESNTSVHSILARLIEISELAKTVSPKSDKLLLSIVGHYSTHTKGWCTRLLNGDLEDVSNFFGQTNQELRARLYRLGKKMTAGLMPSEAALPLVSGHIECGFKSGHKGSWSVNANICECVDCLDLAATTWSKSDAGLLDADLDVSVEVLGREIHHKELDRAVCDERAGNHLMRDQQPSKGIVEDKTESKSNFATTSKCGDSLNSETKASGFRAQQRRSVYSPGHRRYHHADLEELRAFSIGLKMNNSRLQDPKTKLINSMDKKSDLASRSGATGFERLSDIAMQWSLLMEDWRHIISPTADLDPQPKKLPRFYDHRLDESTL